MVVATAVVALGNAAYAQTGVGAFPNKFEFEGPLRDGMAIESLGLVNDADQARILRFVTIGDAGGWLEVREAGTDEAIESIAMAARGEVNLDLVVVVPSDIANGTYEGSLRVLSGSPDPNDTAVEIGVELPVTITITGTQVIAAAMEEFTVGTAEVGTPMPLSVEIRNEGNVAISPEVSVTILDADDTEVVTVVFAQTAIPPGESSLLVDAWSTTDAEAGPYSAVARAAIGRLELPTRLVRFDLAPGGTFSRSGEIVDLELANTPEAGGIAIVNAELMNTSEVTAGIRFNGELTFAGGRVGDVGSLARRVAPGESTIVQVFMEVNKSGMYELTGSADVDGVLSRPSTFTFAVGAPESSPILLYLGVGVTALLGVGFFVWRRRRASE